MTAVLDWIKNNNGLAVLGLVVLALVLTGVTARLMLRLNRIESRWRALLEASALIPSLPFLRSMPRGDGHPVYLLPGFMADSQSTAMLRRWLERPFGSVRWQAEDAPDPRVLVHPRVRAEHGVLSWRQRPHAQGIES